MIEDAKSLDRFGDIVETEVEGARTFRINLKIDYGTYEEARQVLEYLASEYGPARTTPPDLVYGPAWAGPFFRKVDISATDPNWGCIHWRGRTDIPVYRGDGGLNPKDRPQFWRVNS